MNVLISIKPKYVDEILSGKKRYEFRKAIFKRQDVKKVYIYSCLPVGKIVASFDVRGILKGTPKEIWQKCNNYAGISKKEFFSYFKKAKVAYAIEIGNVNSFSPAIDPYKAFANFMPPQSFCYLSKELEIAIQI